jgi:hypothetical protein
MCKYCKILDDYKKGIIILTDNKVFEYVAAIKLNMIMIKKKEYVKPRKLKPREF